MARSLTVLIALMAQGMALMLPVCFVRCASVSGREAVELVGMCHCHRQSAKSHPATCHVTTDCRHHHEHDDELPAPDGFHTDSEPCPCQHSLVKPIQQIQSRPWSPAELARLDVIMAQTLDVFTMSSRLEFVDLLLLSPQESPHLAVLATVALRV